MNLRTSPRPDLDTAGFWSAAGEGRLVVRGCEACANLFHPPADCCPRCGATAVSWRQLSGAGTVYSFIRVHHKFFAGMEAPYIVALVEPVESRYIRFATNIVGADADVVRVGDSVQVSFDRSGPVALPMFVRTQASPAPAT